MSTQGSGLTAGSRVKSVSRCSVLTGPLELAASVTVGLHALARSCPLIPEHLWIAPLGAFLVQWKAAAARGEAGCAAARGEAGRARADGGENRICRG